MQDQYTHGDNGGIITLKQISLQNKLLFGLKNIQDRFYLGKCPKDLFAELLKLAMEVTDSPEGYIAELVTTTNVPQLEVLAGSGHVDETLRAKLTAHLLQEEDIIIYNAKVNSKGDLRSFIGMPARLGDNLIGLICLANREGGYDEAMVEFLEPMQTTFNSLLIFRQLHSDKLIAEGRQQELNGHLNELLKSVDDIVFELNARKVFLNVWVRDENLLFMPKERFLGKTVREVMGPLADQMDALMDRVIISGETDEVEYAHIDPSVGLRFSARVSLINQHETPEQTKLALVIRDVTEQHKLKEEAQNARMLAEREAKAKSRFLSVMSHEIRTPLNGIIGIANLLGLNHTDEQEELVNNLMFSSRHLLQLVNDILDLSKIESGNLELVKEPFSLLQLVGNINTQFGTMAQASGLKLLARIDKGIPEMVIGDPIRLGQVLNNLVSNGLKFTDKGSVTVDISLLNKTEHTVKLRIAVKDTGIGIPVEEQGKVFDSFMQVQQRSPQKYAGTGLGLSITRRLIALHGSEIKLSSTPGEGTEFFFDLDMELPADDNNIKDTKPEHDIESWRDRFATLNFLLVEDNPVNIMVARKQLEHFGIKPDCAQNGMEALELMAGKDYDIALVDLHMPHMDGFELSASIRKNHPGVHIVIFTADILDEAREKVALLNIHDIINKPFVPSELLNILIGVVNGRDK